MYGACPLPLMSAAEWFSITTTTTWSGRGAPGAIAGEVASDEARPVDDVAALDGTSPLLEAGDEQALSAAANTPAMTPRSGRRHRDLTGSPP